MDGNFENVNLKPKVMLTIQIKDKDGNIVKEIIKEDDPLTRWAIRSLYAFLTASGVNIKCEDGAFRVLTPTNFSGWPTDTKIMFWDYKIAIGLDSTPPSYEDFKLGAKERESTTLTTTSLTETDSTGQFDIKMDFLIETDKTFYEFGLFGLGRYGGSQYPFLVSRDVVSAGVPVPANSYLTVIYRVILGTV